MNIEVIDFKINILTVYDTIKATARTLGIGRRYIK
jgi:hypothetical protein